jgi:hypothetical protein
MTPVHLILIRIEYASFHIQSFIASWIPRKEIIAWTFSRIKLSVLDPGSLNPDKCIFLNLDTDPDP